MIKIKNKKFPSIFPSNIRRIKNCGTTTFICPIFPCFYFYSYQTIQLLNFHLKIRLIFFILLFFLPAKHTLKIWSKCFKYIYIYIYRERERESKHQRNNKSLRERKIKWCRHLLPKWRTIERMNEFFFYVICYKKKKEKKKKKEECINPSSYLVWRWKDEESEKLCLKLTTSMIIL